MIKVVCNPFLPPGTIVLMQDPEPAHLMPRWPLDPHSDSLLAFSYALHAMISPPKMRVYTGASIEPRVRIRCPKSRRARNQRILDHKSRPRWRKRRAELARRRAAR
jgi:hypothetical protein